MTSGVSNMITLNFKLWHEDTQNQNKSVAKLRILSFIKANGQWLVFWQTDDYLGDGVFWEVFVGEVTGLDQLAGDLGVCRVKGLPIVAWEM